MSILQSPWTSQPQQVTGVRRDAFPGRPLVYASRVSDGCFDQVGNRPPVAVSASRPTTSISSAGVAGEFVPANSQYYSITTATNLVSGSTLTVACWARIDSITAGGVMYSLNGTGYSAILGLLSSAFLVNQNSAASTNVVLASGSDLGLHHIVCVHRSNTFSLYVDGVLRSQGAASNYWGQPAAGNHSIGNRLNGASPQYFDGAIQDLYVFQGELTESEAKSLYRNHWQVFQPIPRRIFVPAPTSSGLYTLTAQSGSYAISGQQATLLRHRNLTASAGTYNITGQSVNITYSPTAAVYTLTAQAGSYALTGSSATLLKSKLLSASSGSYSITGNSATISKNRVLTATSGSYTITGHSATLTYIPLTPVYTLTAQTGVYNITGQTAQLLRHRLLTTSSGSYVYTGQSIIINKYTSGTSSLVKYVNVLTGEVLILKQLGV